MVFQNEILAGGGASTYEISQSIRFNAADSAYLTRTPGSASNRKTWTFSFWWKVNTLASATGSGYRILQANSTEFGWSDEDDNLYLIDGSTIFQTTQVFRDPTAWQHIVLAVDTTDATAADRVKLYINGSQVTSFVSGPTVAQDFTFDVNDNTAQNIGKEGSNYLDAYVAEIQLVDGTQLAASSFGETNSDGVWVPKAYTGSYGTNGFFIDGRDSSDLGDDESGNGNDFTSSGLTSDDQRGDTPTANHATWNPLFFRRTGSYKPTFANGNLYVAGQGSQVSHTGTTIASSGKHYAEFLVNNGSSSITGPGVVRTLWDGGLANSYASNFGGSYYGDNGTRYYNATSDSQTAPGSNRVGIEVDFAGNEVQYFIVESDGTKTAAGDVLAAGDGIDFDGEGIFTATLHDNSSRNITAYFEEADWYGTPNTGYVALNTANLPSPAITDGSAHFQTTLYTGNGTAIGSGGLAVSQSGNSTFQPDFVWIKKRSGAADHALYDAVRGTTKDLASNNTSSETTEPEGLTTFGSAGFTVGNLAKANTSSDTYVAWQWLANGSGSSNEDGSINTTATSVNTTAGFSMSTYTGTGSNATVGHGLGVTPSVVLVMPRSNGDHKMISNWEDGVTAFTEKLLLDTNQAADSTGTTQIIGGSSTTFSLGTDTNVNGSGRTYVAYCWAEVEGYSKMGTYTGNGSTDGPFIYTGFKPAFVLFKKTSLTDSWELFDNTRPGYNATGLGLFPNTTAAEATGRNIDILSNGIKQRNANGTTNESGDTYIYMAFAEHPFGGDGVAPATAQ